MRTMRHLPVCCLMFVLTIPALIAAQIYSPANVPNDQIQKVTGLEQLAAVTEVPDSAACEALCTGKSGNLGFFSYDGQQLTAYHSLCRSQLSS